MHLYHLIFFISGMEEEKYVVQTAKRHVPFSKMVLYLRVTGFEEGVISESTIFEEVAISESTVAEDGAICESTVFENGTIYKSAVFEDGAISESSVHNTFNGFGNMEI